MATYEIKKSTFGDDKLLYKCPQCASDLESKLHEAGGRETCPICGSPFVVPGQDELRRREAEQKRQEAEDTQRKRAEERHRAAEAEQHRLETLKRDAEKKLKRNMASQTQQEAAVNEVQGYTMIDRLLRIFFKLGRTASVVILVLSALAIVWMGFKIMTTEVSKPARTPVTVQSPTAQEYEQYKQYVKTASKEQARQALTRPRQANTPQQQSIEATLCRKYGLDEDSLARFLEDVDLEYRSRLCSELDSFLAGQRDKTPEALNEAAMWYVFRFESGVRDAKQQQERVERQIVQARAEQWGYLTVIMGCFGAALGFLVLPLLIQIERNTRSLIAK